MIRSMTAFARAESVQPWGTLTWELRSVNHRYLEPGFKLPDAARGLEPRLRELLRQRVERGKVEVQLRIAQAAGASHPAPDLALAAEVVRAAEAVAALMASPAPVSPLEILRWPGVLEQEVLEGDTLAAAALAGFERALEALGEARAREGAALAGLMLERLEAIAAITARVRAAMPRILEAQRSRLQARLAELRVELDPGRLEQELVILAQRADVEEELDRLATHAAEVRRVLQQGGACGRRLDFLMQELNREANTLGSKSIAADTTQAAVDLKVLIEQMREQVQNIE